MMNMEDIARMAEGWEADANKLGYKIKSSPDGQHAYRHDSDKVSHVGTNNKNISWLYHPDESGKSIKKDYKQGVAEGSDELYQKAIRKYTENVAHDCLGGGNEHVYGANKFDSEMFGVSSKQAQRDFDLLFPQHIKKLQGRKSDD